MPTSLQSLLELPSTMGPAVTLFGDDTFLAKNTRLQKLAGRVQNCKTKYRWDKMDFPRALAPANGRSAASRTVNVDGVTTKEIPGVYFRINHAFKGEELHALRNPGDIADNGAAVVMRAKRALRQRLLLSKEKLWSMALKGTTTINSTNFPDGTVEGVSISWGVTTLAVSASWATIGTSIVAADVQTMRAAITDASGYDIGRFLFNESITKDLLKNTEVKSYLSALPASEKQFRTARFDAMGGVENWEEYKGSYKPEGGSLTRFILDNELIALPDGVEQLLVEARYEMDVPAVNFVASSAEGGMPGTSYGDEEGINYYVYNTPDPAGMVLVAQMGVQPILGLPETIGFESDITS